ncbi:Proclotting enzyme [Smittium culicis]|uniref:Proclotting enzyme n=1 Tax=Smittium culicis TaxID=133412 RepID=A0A1R1YSR0_9FUNG|nr:Proclotting enzyme [Smittium culicis]
MDEISIKSIHIHEKFGHGPSLNDIGIMVLEDVISENQEKEYGIEYGKIFNKLIYEDMKTVAIGWGKQFQDGNSSDKLRVTDILISDSKLCESADFRYDGNNEMSICSENINGNGICGGDSGGPLLYNEDNLESNNAKKAVVGISMKMAGIDQNKKKCEEIGIINYFVNTFYHLDWISNTSGIPRSDLHHNHFDNQYQYQNQDQYQNKHQNRN